jgi:hypothetical protein
VLLIHDIKSYLRTVSATAHFFNWVVAIILTFFIHRLSFLFFYKGLYTTKFLVDIFGTGEINVDRYPEGIAAV